MEAIPSINQVANDWTKYTIERWKKNLLKKRIGKSGDGMNSFLSRVVIGAGGDAEKIQFGYLNYLKFVDIGIGRGQKLGSVKGNAEVFKAAGLHGRSAKKWYSKTMFAETNKLADLLAKNYGIQANAQVIESFPPTIEIKL